jgi:hypothetical protein
MSDNTRVRVLTVYIIHHKPGAKVRKNLPRSLQTQLYD